MATGMDRLKSLRPTVKTREQMNIGRKTYTAEDFLPLASTVGRNYGTGTPQQQALKTEIQNNKNKLNQAGQPLPNMKHDDPWYIDVLNVLSAPQRSITGMLAEATDRDGSGFLDVLRAGKDGFLMREKRDSDEFLENLGWKDKKGLGVHDIASFALDVGLDPLTYLTFGGSSALKAGAKTVQSTAKQVAKDAGVNAVTKGSVNDVASNVARAVTDARINNLNPAINPSLAKRFADQQYSKVYNQILDAGKARRATAQNALLNIDVPFTNITRQIGQKPAPLRKMDGLIGATQVNVARHFLDELGVKPEQLSELLDARYGKTSLDKFTIQEFDDLMKNGLGIRQVPLRGNPTVKTTSVLEEFDNIPSFNNSKKMSEWLEPHLDKLGFPKADGWTAKTLHKALENDPAGRTKVLQEMIDTVLTRGTPMGQRVVTSTVDDFASMAEKAIRPNVALTRSDNAGRFVADMGGRSQIGKRLSNMASAVRPRTLGSTDDVVNESAGKILDADNKVYGQTIQMNKELKAIEQSMKGLNEDELRAVDYILERRTPEGTKIEDFVRPENMERVQKVAEEARNIYKRLGDLDLQAGTIPKLRENYARHAIRSDGDSLEEILSDPDVAKYLGRSATNRASLERKGFETFAELDDAVMALRKAMDEPGADVDALASQIDRLENLFHRNPLESLADRYQQSIRSRAYKELGETLQRSGLIVKPNSGDPIPRSDLKNYEKVSELSKEKQRIAGQIGLESGDRIHKEVLNGLERVDQLFTDAGMNKTFRNIESALNVWKGLVTVNVPSHHVFNIIGNVANATLAGVTPKSYKKAEAILRGQGDQEIYRKALDHGILNQGIASDLGLAFEKEARKSLSLGERAVFNNPWANQLNRFGHFGDNISRMALFIHALDKTGSEKIASQQVRRYLFNYREMTKTDRAIRLVVPFWNWTKNNLPLQIMEFLKQPRYYNMFQELREMFNEDQPQEMMPEYARDDYWKVPGQDDTLFNPRLPFQELGGVSEPLNTALGMISPGLKIPTELAMNKQLFNGMPIDSTRDDVNGWDWSQNGGIWEYVANQIGLPGRVMKNHILPNDYSLDTGVDTLLQSIFGKPVEVDREKQETSNLYRERDILRNAVKRAERNGQIQ